MPPPPALSAATVGSTISRVDAVADVDTLLRILENVHPDLYAERPRDSVAAARERLVAALPSSITRADLWTRLAPFVAAFGDGHTSVYMPQEEVARLHAAGALVFPPSVVEDDAGRLVVSAPLARNTPIERGDRILSLNGKSADSLVQAWQRDESGESDIYRIANVTSAFRDLLLVHSIGAPYVLEVEGHDGTIRTVTMNGLLQDSLRALIVRGGARRPGAPNFSYELLPSHVGYMNLRSLSGDLPRFKTDIAELFRRVAADSAQTLIIDLRNNGGGDSRLGDELLRYITTKPYRMSAEKDWKMSAEYRAYLKSFVRAPLSWFPVWKLHSLGRALFRGPDGTIVSLPEAPTAHPAGEPFLAGAVCVLIGRQTFSSAVDLADAIKTYRLATLIGEETGGRPNSFAEAYVFRLPRSQLGVSVSSARFVRASGDTSDHRGVVPDIVVNVSDADRRAGRDVARERASQCASSR